MPSTAQHVELDTEPTVISSTKPVVPSTTQGIGACDNSQRPSLPTQVHGQPRRLAWISLASACCVSACLGAGAAWLALPPHTDTEELVSVEAQPVYLASTTRRIEPITPILPFRNLSSEVVALGGKLFHDSKLSSSGKVACANCHDIDEGGDDGVALARGISGQHLSRNAPTVLNAALNFAQGWDASAESLEDQLDEHFGSEAVMGADWERVVLAISQDPLYNRSFQIYMGSEPNQQLIRQALATYQRSLLTVDSKFDHWLQGDEQALDGDEIAGYYLFKKYNCISCHQGDGVGGKMTQRVDKMREYFNQSGTPLPAEMTHVRVPALRNIELTRPYFHDGSAESLDEAVEAMMRYQLDLQPNPVDVQRISAFLRTLTGEIPASAHAALPQP